MSIRVVLADDNVFVREGVRALLDATDGVEVVAVAEDAPTLLAAAGEHSPDVVVTDIKMPPSFQLDRDGTLYEDPGADFFTRLHPERAKNRALHQLEAMDYQVTLGRAGQQTSP